MRFEDLCALARGISGHPVVTADELYLAGAGPDDLRCALSCGWQAAARGIYVVDGSAIEGHVLALVAVKRGGPGAVLTGLLAARHLGLRWVPDLPGAMVLVTADTRRRMVEDVVVVRRTSDHDLLVTSDWDGVPVAPAARVVVDAARQVIAHHRNRLQGTPPPSLRAFVDARCLRDIRGLVLGAVVDGHCSVGDLLRVLGTGSTRDTSLVRRACRDAERGAASPPEAELVDGLLALGVPFACNVELWRDGQLVAVVDVWLVGTGVGGEMDSREAHGSEDLLDATLVRHARLTDLGAELLHVTPTRYRADPDAFHRSLLAAAERRGRAGLGDPPGVELRLRGPVLGLVDPAAA